MTSEASICRFIKFKGSHCESCHTDQDEFGYDMIYLELGKHGNLEICCTVSNALDECRQVQPSGRFNFRPVCTTLKDSPRRKDERDNEERIHAL